MDEFAEPLLVLGVDVCVNQADRHTLNLAALENTKFISGLRLVQRYQHAAVGLRALQNSPP